ncbi:MAG: hypothetical protein CMC15_18740 [Flavobacteriaceae bacterium]|nr:hypothetical protein [Flavobacteriaceae bacterium]
MPSANTIEQLRALLIPEVQRMFLQAMDGVVDRAMLDEMIAAIEANDAERLFRATGFTPAVLNQVIDVVERAYKESAEMTVDGWPKRIATPFGPVVFRFDIRNTRVEQDLRNSSSRLISNITQEIRDNVRETLERGMIAGENPRKTALDIVGRYDRRTGKRVGGIIGLSRNQVSWVEKVNRYLENGDKTYLNLRLRDRRFDKIVSRAIEENKKLTDDQISKITTAYKVKALKYRAEAIARTETIQSINRGEYSAYLQAVEEGVVQRSAVTKEWDDVGDGKVRTSHSVLGKKYGRNNGIGLEEEFISPTGARFLHPGDTSLGAGAEEITHCRCKTRYRIDFLKGVA